MKLEVNPYDTIIMIVKKDNEVIRKHKIVVKKMGGLKVYDYAN